MQRNDVVVGIDIGGTQTSFGFVNRRGAILACATMPTLPGNSAELFVARLCAQVADLSAKLPEDQLLCGIGIGAPNAHHGRGTLEKPVNLNWGDSVPFQQMIRAHYHVPVSLTNDANAAALGEMMFGGARGLKDFMVITLGTGLGSGIVVGGRLLYGASGFAGELGHTLVDPDGRLCGCGKRGCLETYVSATGLVRSTLELLALRWLPTPLRAMSLPEVTSKKIFELACDGDALALAAFDSTARILGMKLADAVAHLSPEAIFLSGGLSDAGDLLLKPAQRYLDEYLFGVYRGTVRLLPSGLASGTGAIMGAAALIWSELDS